VTILAMFRFVRIEGPLSAIGMPINIGLIALVWWSAHKLTWDCTVIDEAEDASGEGLMQTIGFENTLVDNAPESNVENTAVEDDRRNAAINDGGLMQRWNRFVKRQRRPHSPGVWVIYYSLAALPLFGFGQWFIASEDVAARRSAFFLLCVYVASGMALLLTTSFLGMRRYLRQRRLEMPMDMAGVWLVVGAIMIVVLLLACSVLPRPNSEIALSEFPLSFGSPDHQQTNRRAFGNDGPQRPQGSRYRPDQQDNQQSSSAPPPTSQSQQSGGKRNGQQGKTGQSSQGKQDGGSSAKGKDSQKNGRSEANKQGQGSQNDQQGERQGESQSAGSQSGDQGRQQEQSGKQAGKRAGKGQDSEGKAGQQPDANKVAGKQQGRGKQQREDQDAQKTRQGAAADEQSPPRRNADAQQRRNQANDNRTEQSNRQQSQPNRQQNQRENRDQRQQTEPPQQSPRNFVQLAQRGMSTIFKLILYGILLAVVVFFAWKYREQIREVINQWIEQLRQLWERLFGNRRTAEMAEENEASQPPTWRPFSSYEDPFATGRASQYSTEQLVRYSFEAMEAWARDHGCPRHDDQTPMEFARQVAGHAPELASEAQVLSDLYSRVAYGRERVRQDRQADLQELWQQLKRAAPPHQTLA
jgi:hypothetical protein